MDTHVKEGQLYVQHQKFGKKWKKNWFVLYPASQNGIARLEFYDCSSSSSLSSSSGGGGASGGGGSGGGSNEKTRKLDKKIIRLSECISILPAVTESCPKDNMEAFCVETNDKTHVFAAEKSLSHQWVEQMCEIAFQGGGGSGGFSSSSVSDSNGQKKDLQMAENQIYCSREEVNEFWVSVQRTEVSECCGLQGSYWLKADRDSLVLSEPKTKRPVLVWPYRLLRRYGRDRMMFSFEAGRRCDSGPGSFTFETKQGNEIFSLVEKAIQSQKALAEERHLSCPANFDPDCPASLQQLRSGAGGVPGGGAGSGSDRDSSGGSKPGSADGVFGKREGGDGGGGGGAGLKGRTLPDPPALVAGGLPPRSSVPRLGASSVGNVSAGGASSPDEEVNVYSEPADIVRLPPSSFGTESFYSDPVDTIVTHNHNMNPSPPIPTPRLRPVGDDGGRSHGTQAEPLYSDLYDRVSLDLVSRTGALGLDSGRGGVGLADGCNGSKRPPGGHAEGSSSSSSSSGWKPTEHIYDEPEGCGTAEAPPKVAAPPPAGSEGKDSHGTTPPYGKPKQPHVTPPPPFPSAAPPQGHLGGGPAPPAIRRPKPLTAPKPSKGAWKETVPLPPPGKPGAPNTNTNNNKGGGGGGGGSTVSHHKSPPSGWYPRPHQPPLQTPDIIYDNLGDI